ncbi:MAG: hypothetical protein FWD03_07925 [Defluviitaleaceae bacterium]|nr:hypothetical protein [Defluviitaleaceae bacterium]
MKKHNEYLDNISVDPVLHKKIMRAVTAPPKRFYQSRQSQIVFRYAAAAACAMALLLGIWIIPGLGSSDDTSGLIAHEPENRPPDRENIPPLPPRFVPIVAPTRTFTAISLQHVDAAPLIKPQWDVPDPAAVQAAQGANDFAFRLSAALAPGIGHDNFVVSPYSVWMPLAALLNATDSAHQPALLEALSAGGITPTDINRAASRMLFDLTNERARHWGWGEGHEENPIHIANAIFVDRSHTLRQDFAQTFMDYYRGEMIQVDFLDPMAVEEVNLWASDNTHGLITEIVQEFDPLTVAAIANAIFFSDRWVHQFDPDQTQRDIFHSPAGESDAYFMQMEWPVTFYFEDERVQAINLPFMGSSGMKIILPKDGDAVGLLASMTNAYFNRMHDEAVLAEGKLLLPRFSIENTLSNLTDSLIALDVPLFDAATAPLTGGLIEEDLPVWINNAVQAAMITIDEEGATAAAVTMAGLAGSGLMEIVTTFEMICNHPFVFVLHSYTPDGGRQVLFTGAVNQP